MVSKTRDRLIEVARQLFVNKGVENTTMNDIAAASEKGRRTIYTYFKNKREIYNAVVESESNAIISQLEKIADSDLPITEKLSQYLHKRFEVIANQSSQPRGPIGRYRSIFNRDARRIGKIYDLARLKEQTLFQRLLETGVKAGAFNPQQARRLPDLLSLVYLTTDHLPLNSITISEPDMTMLCHNAVEFVTHGLITKSTNNE